MYYIPLSKTDAGLTAADVRISDITKLIKIDSQRSNYRWHVVHEKFGLARVYVYPAS